MSSDFERDRLFSLPREKADFHFDEAVVNVFPDMIQRSIPGYRVLLGLAGVIAGECVQPGERVYDLGCSLGGVSLTLCRHIPQSAEIIALDNSHAMVKRFRSMVFESVQAAKIEVEQADIAQYDFLPAAMFCAVFTLQFVARRQRLPILQRVYQALRPQGVLLLAEKTALNEEYDILNQWHEAFKLYNGYSKLEVSQKRAALENVMQVDTQEQNVARLYQAGFSKVIPIFRGLSFVAWAAIK